jgi:hypothetical protein
MRSEAVSHQCALAEESGDKRWRVEAMQTLMAGSVLRWRTPSAAPERGSPTASQLAPLLT